MTISSYDERALLTHPTDGVIEVLRDGDNVEWTGYPSVDDRRGNGIGGAQTGTIADVVRVLAAEGYTVEIPAAEARPLPPDGRPDGTVCALATGPLADDDRTQVERFRQYLADRQAILAKHTPRLKAMSAGDPQYAEVWDRRAAELDALLVSYEVPAAPTAETTGADR
jgi:hypothetical protein